jgi:hypothetical protein
MPLPQTVVAQTAASAPHTSVDGLPGIRQRQPASTCRQPAEQPSPPVVLPSSQSSSDDRNPFPHAYASTQGCPNRGHTEHGSTRQLLQPSPFTAFPSSHSSPGSWRPLPQRLRLVSLESCAMSKASCSSVCTTTVTAASAPGEIPVAFVQARPTTLEKARPSSRQPRVKPPRALLRAPHILRSLPCSWADRRYQGSCGADAPRPGMGSEETPTGEHSVNHAVAPLCPSRPCLGRPWGRLPDAARSTADDRTEPIAVRRTTIGRGAKVVRWSPPRMGALRQCDLPG